jgi:hypothetical protein
MLGCFKNQQTRKSQDVFVAKGVEKKPQPKADQKSLSKTPAEKGAKAPKPDSTKKGCFGAIGNCLDMIICCPCLTAGACAAAI